MAHSCADWLETRIVNGFSYIDARLHARPLVLSSWALWKRGWHDVINFITEDSFVRSLPFAHCSTHLAQKSSTQSHEHFAQNGTSF